MNEEQLIAYMRVQGRKSISLVQMHLKMSFKSAKAFCDSFELIWEVIPSIKAKRKIRIK